MLLLHACIDHVRVTACYAGENVTDLILRPGDSFLGGNGYRKQVLFVYDQKATVTLCIHLSTLPLFLLDETAFNGVSWLKEEGPGTQYTLERRTTLLYHIFMNNLYMKEPNGVMILPYSRFLDSRHDIIFLEVLRVRTMVLPAHQRKDVRARWLRQNIPLSVSLRCVGNEILRGCISIAHAWQRCSQL